MEVLAKSIEAPDAGRLTPTSSGAAAAGAGQRTGKEFGRLLLILALAAGLRVTLWTCFQGQPLHIQDEQEYNRLACNLAEYGEYGFERGKPDSLRPPLYPAVVAGVYRLFGPENHQAVRLLQALLSLANVVLLYRLGSMLLPRPGGLWLAGLCAFYPSLLGYNNLLLSETLFTLLLSAFCTVFVGALQRASLPAVAGSAALLALAALTRSVVWLLPPVLAGFLLLAYRGGWRRRAWAALAFVVVFAAILAPWAIRNTRLQKTFIVVDVMGGRNFMMGNYRHTPLYRSWATIDLCQKEMSWIHEVRQTYPPQERQTQGQIDKLALRQGLRFVADNPGLTLQRALVKFFDFWGLERELIAAADHDFFGHLPRPVLAVLALLVCGSYVLALFTALFGMILAPPADRRAHWFLILVLAYVCALHTLSFGHSRYHIPLIPLVLVYSAAAAVGRRKIGWQKEGWRFGLACGLCAVFVGGWLCQIVAVDSDNLIRLLHGIV